jgi:hypothetical protein
MAWEEEGAKMYVKIQKLTIYGQLKNNKSPWATKHHIAQFSIGETVDAKWVLPFRGD